MRSVATTKVTDSYTKLLTTATREDWEVYVLESPIRDNLFWTALLLLNRSGGRPRGKGFNRIDCHQSRIDGLPGTIFSMDTFRLRGWSLRILKYRKQLASMGITYPRTLFIVGNISQQRCTLYE